MSWWQRPRVRWAVPGLVAVVIALVALIPNLSAGATTPTLPQLSARQLVTKALAARPGSVTGTVQLTANLGIPSLGSVQGVTGGGGGGFNWQDYLSGTHSADVQATAGNLHVTQYGQLSENDLIVNGSQAWAWQSQGSKVTHYLLPAGQPDSSTQPSPSGAPTTPQQLATNFLDHLSPTTAISVGSSLTVADHSAYQLLLAPQDPSSTIGSVAIAVDADTGTVLQVTVTARGATSPALQLGFTRFSAQTPPSSAFQFTPPPGSKVTTTDLSGAATGGNTTGAQSGHSRTVVGHSWTSVLIASGVQPGGQAGNMLAKVGTPVSGAFGSGELVSTTLLNALVLNDGRVAVGFVTPSALEAAVAQG